MKQLDFGLASVYVSFGPFARPPTSESKLAPYVEKLREECIFIAKDLIQSRIHLRLHYTFNMMYVKLYSRTQ
uniref:Uncharacterized protein n=1 Tax=Solanum lycopersicum TaxID=4081 RepID=A0A3Q7HYL0_SOLLC